MLTDEEMERMRAISAELVGSNERYAALMEVFDIIIDELYADFSDEDKRKLISLTLSAREMGYLIGREMEARYAEWEYYDD